MAVSSSSKTRRGFLAGGAGILGIASVVSGLKVKFLKDRRNARAEVSRLVARIDLPGGIDAMMTSFARDPEKVNRFRELQQWREKQEQVPQAITRDVHRAAVIDVTGPCGAPPQNQEHCRGQHQQPRSKVYLSPEAQPCEQG